MVPLSISFCIFPLSTRAFLLAETSTLRLLNVHRASRWERIRALVDLSPSWRTGLLDAGEHVCLRAMSRETLAKEGLLRLVACQRECPQLGCVGLLTSPQFQQEWS